MDKLEIKTEKDDINLDLDLQPDLTVADNNGLLGVELLVDPSKNSGEKKIDINVNTDVNEDINLFKNNDLNDDPIMKTIDMNDNNHTEGYVPLHMMSQNDIKNEKIDLIYKFKKLENQGIDTTMHYNMNSGLDAVADDHVPPAPPPIKNLSVEAGEVPSPIWRAHVSPVVLPCVSITGSPAS